MPLVTATISGQLIRPDQGASASTVIIEAATDGGRITVPGVAIDGRIRVPVNSDGTASATIPTTDQTGLLPAGAKWRLIVQNVAGTYTSAPFELTADTTWDEIIETAEVPYTPSIITQVNEAASDASASATAAAASAAAAEAVGATNDAIMAGVFEDTGSDFRGATDGVYTTVSEAPVNPARFGAKADGVTDDTAALQAAMNSMVAGQTLRLLPGKTYVAGSNQLIPKAGTIIDGRGATILQKPGVTVTFNLFRATDGCKITGLTIDMNKANTTDPGVDTQGNGMYFQTGTFTKPVVLEDVTVRNGYQHGIRIASGAALTDPLTDVPEQHVVLLGVEATNNGKRGIFIDRMRGIKIANCTANNNGTDGILLYQSASIVVDNCITNGNTGHGLCTVVVADTAIRGVIARGNANDGICMGGGLEGKTPSYNYSIVGCVTSGNTFHGIALDPTLASQPNVAQAAYASLVGNVCNGNQSHGIYLNNPRYVSVTGNVCKGNVNEGIQVTAADITIDGNTLIGNNIGLAFNGTQSPDRDRFRVGINTYSGNTSAQTFVSDSNFDIAWVTTSGSPPAA